MRAFAERCVGRIRRLDVDDHVRARHRPFDGVLDRVGDRMPLLDRRSGRDADDHVGEVPAGSPPHPEPPQLDVLLEPFDGAPGDLRRTPPALGP